MVPTGLQILQSAGRYIVSIKQDTFLEEHQDLMNKCLYVVSCPNFYTVYEDQDGSSSDVAKAVLVPFTGVLQPDKEEKGKHKHVTVQVRRLDNYRLIFQRAFDL